MTPNTRVVAVIGGGPAGLMAADVLSQAGVGVNLYDGMRTVGRKLLVAGRGGLNLTHDEPMEAFARRYGEHADFFAGLLRRFSPDHVRAWARELGVETFVGSSGRVFPVGMKSTPLLRAWLQRLRERGVSFHTRHRWTGFTPDCALRFERDDDASVIEARPDVTVLALGGASYPHLGSDGGWVSILEALGVEITPLQPSNCGYDVAWSEPFRSRGPGTPLKNLRLTVGEHTVEGELMLTEHGVEGGGVYQLGPDIRSAIAEHGRAVLHLDLKRDWSGDEVLRRLGRPRGSASWGNFVRKALRVRPPVPALLAECIPAEGRNNPARLARAVKQLPLVLLRPRPIEEAISAAGGVAFSALTEDLMLKAQPGVFVAGEMLEYDAPTGGYLLQAALATGVRAAEGARRWLEGMAD